MKKELRKLQSLSKKLEGYIAPAPDEDKCSNIENEMYADMANLINSIDNFLYEEKRKINNVKCGDIIICQDVYSHDYVEHLFKVTSIECDKEFVTDENPTGIVLYGKDLSCDEEDDNFIGMVAEEAFVSITDN